MSSWDIVQTEFQGDETTNFGPRKEAGTALYQVDTLATISTRNESLIPHGSRSKDVRTFQKMVFYPDSTDLVVLASSGLMFVVKDLKPAAFTQKCDNIASIIQQQLQFAVVQTSDVHTDKTLDVAPLGQGAVITAGSGDSVLAVWEWDNDGPVLVDSVCGLTDTDAGIVCVKLASNNKVLFAVDENDQIGMWCVPALLLLNQFKSPAASSCITDFLLLETQGTQKYSVDGTRLVMLETSTDEDSQDGTTVRILSLPDGESVYVLQLGRPTCLPRCPATQECLFIAEGTPDSEDPQKLSTVRFRSLTETNPETRLLRILHKKKFDEALNFASLFQLDTELSPWNVICHDEEKVSAMVTQLWACLSNVKDCLLVSENCMRAALPTFTDTWKLLQLCQKKLESGKTDKVERLHALQTKLLDLQNRLLTYKLMYGADNFSAESWMRFQQANLLHTACYHMMEQQPHIAILLWRRHVEEWTGQMTSQVVGQLLMAVPDRLVGVDMLGWLLDDVVPFIARVLPESLSQVVQWAVQRAENMEFAEKDKWPKNALDFLNAVTKQVTEVTEVNFSNTTSTAAQNATKTRIEVCAVLEPLRSTLQTLQQLYDLQQYNLRLPLSQFQQESRETLAFRMLDRVVMVELIQPTLKQYIAPYMRAYNLNQDHIFATYIKEKCCAVLNVMKHAPLPWSPEIQQLVEDGLKIQHPMVKELQEQKKIAGVRQLLQQYDLKICSVPSQSQAQKVARMIVEKDCETSLEDALRVLKEYNITCSNAKGDIYLRHARILITSDRVMNYMTMLRSVAPSLAMQYGLQVVSLAEIFLDQSPPAILKQIEEKHQQQMTEAAVLTLRHLITLTKDPLELEELNLQLTLFCSLFSLQSEYGIFMSVKDYASDLIRGETFARLTQQFLKEQNLLQDAGGLARLYRLADLLLLRREEVQGELAVCEAKGGNMDAAVFLCRELLQAESSCEAGRALCQAALALLYLQSENDHVEEDGSDQPYHRCLPDLVKQLASRALVMCDTELLPHCLELSKAAQLWKNVSGQCEASDSPKSIVSENVDKESKLTCKNPVQTYTLSPVYRDDALVMSSSIALPLANCSLAATFALVEGDEGGEDEEMGVSVTGALGHLQPIVAHLRENSHLQLALRFLVHTYTVVRQTLLQQDMGLQVCERVQQWLEKERSVVQGSETRAAQVTKDLVAGILAKVFSAQAVDHKMALAYLLSVPRKVSVDCLKKSISSCGLNFRKLGALASVGVALGHLLKETSLIATCQELETSATWGVRLGKLKISFKEAFQGGVSAKHDVIAALARSELSDITMVRDFCTDFRVDPEDGFLVYLQHLLTRPPGADIMDCPTDSARLARARATVAAVLALDRESVLLNKLNLLYKQTSPYDYENIEFLLGEINKLEPLPVHQKGLKLVHYLKVYTRHNPPSEYEVSNVCQEQKDE
ncbi:hypothetical protein BaRGS_00011836, partial [Batillaria attramentaria]